MEAYIKEQTRPIRQIYTLSEWVDEWLNAYTQNLAIGTQRTKKCCLARFCRFHSFEERPLSSFRPIDLQRFYNSLDGLSKTHIQNIRNAVESLFKSAFSNRLLEPFDLTALTVPKGELGTHRAITEREKDIITSTWEEHPVGKYAMGYLYTGARHNELLALQWSDIDLVNETISINKAYSRFTDGFVQTKSKAGNRTVPLLAPLKKVLLTLPKDKPPFEPHCALFDLWRTYKKFLESKGITENITPHDLRDTYATMLYDLGVDVKVTQKLLGHKSASTTMQFYIRLSENKEESETQKIKGFFRS